MTAVEVFIDAAGAPIGRADRAGHGSRAARSGRAARVTRAARVIRVRHHNDE